MSEEKLGFVGKQVKDIYGTYIGKVVGVVTEIGGEIETVGVDCGSNGLKQLPYEQLVMQGDYVFFIPKWRLDAQKLLRQKSLTLKRVKALQDIVAENDTMKEDAELVYLKYEKKLQELESIEKAVIEKLQARISELDSESRNIRIVLFDAKLQFRSNEMKEETYEQVKVQTDELLEHINNERTEIGNVRNKLANLTLESITSTPTASAEEAAAAIAEEKQQQQGPATSTDTATPEQPSELEKIPVVASAIVGSGGEHTETVPNASTVQETSSSEGEEQQQQPSETSWLGQVIQRQQHS